MRYSEICEASFLNSAQPYEYHLAGITTQTREFDDAGGFLKHPIEKTKYAFHSDNGLHYIVHCNLENHHLETSFTVLGGQIALNGAGDALRVLATVSHIVGTYAKADPPRSITFTARQDEPSRVRLYDQMCKQAGRYFPGYHVEKRAPFGRNIKYVLARPLTQEDHDRDQHEAEERAKAAEQRKAATVAAAQAAKDEPPLSQEEQDRFNQWFDNLSPEDEALLGLR